MCSAVNHLGTRRWHLKSLFHKQILEATALSILVYSEIRLEYILLHRKEAWDVNDASWVRKIIINTMI